MGTNYYHERGSVETHRCPRCGDRCERCEGETRTHIGKSSAGWTFSFHATETIRSYRDWLAVLESGGRIVNEYGEEVSLDEFKARVEGKRSSPNSHAKEALRGAWGSHYASTQFLDPEGHSFNEGEFS
jgi:hypothetical protein